MNLTDSKNEFSDYFLVYKNNYAIIMYFGFLTDYLIFYGNKVEK